MKEFMGKDFLLSNEPAKKLFFNYAQNLPIIDYHCHLKPSELAGDKRYDSITEVWLGGDHYKWRAMRGAGVAEEYITGNADPYEKFLAWAKTMPLCVGNPLYHWTHLELRRYFGISEPLSEKTAKYIYDACNEKLRTPEFSARGLVTRSNVETVCTTDDPADDLKYHKVIAQDKSFKTRVLPTYRPDKAVNIQKPGYAEYIARLGDAAGRKIADFAALKAALSARLDAFCAVGCRISDHALDTVEFCEPCDGAADAAMKKALAGEPITDAERTVYRATLLGFLGGEYAKRNMTMQIHIAAMRDVNTRMYRSLGPDTGYDAIEDATIARPLAKLLDAMDKTGGLPKIVLYSLNPCHNEVLIALATCFNEGPAVGKVQLGSGWWFNDQLDGMRRQMTALSSVGLLSGFVGMLTDSRSFMSYPRHEYFRRILCDMVGGWAERGEVPEDYELLGKIVSDISYYNSKNYFFM
ncbi:MAG: glucuronate isomerase [Clostridiaceae bacterium]|nr:glucuronate isomerase [Clostridiaceae bacterium]